MERCSAIVQYGLVKCDVRIPINTEEPALLSNLVYGEKEIWKQPSNPLVLCSPANHAALTPKHPSKMVVVRFNVIQHEFNGRCALNTAEGGWQSHVGPRCKNHFRDRCDSGYSTFLLGDFLQVSMGVLRANSHVPGAYGNNYTD